MREGLRPGEIVGLQLGHEGWVDLYRTPDLSGKSRHSRIEEIPTSDCVTATTSAVLEQYLSLLTDLRPEAWLFPSETGTPLSYSGVYRRRIQPALRRVGMGHVNFQILRRTYVTEFSEAEEEIRRFAPRWQGIALTFMRTNTGKREPGF